MQAAVVDHKRMTCRHWAAVAIIISALKQLLFEQAAVITARPS
jgi:hypothetical protein